jgi:uncharacterized protein YggE
MKRKAFWLLVILLNSPVPCWGQVSGNVNYGQGGGKARAEQSERSRRQMTKEDMPPTGTSMFVEANVLLNVKADEYVAVFGLLQEGPTVAECQQKMDATLQQFTKAVQTLGIEEKNIHIDFVAQNKIYGYEVAGDIAKEKLVGFELKKNIALRYKDSTLLDKLTLAAAQVQIYDLIKVDYIVKDTEKIRDQLMGEAARIIKRKTGRYEKLLGIKLQQPPQIYAEKAGIHYPTQMYDSYQAFETEGMSNTPLRQRYMIQGARKSRTFFYNGLDGDGFDAVLNPVLLEPMVQFTLHLKMKFEMEQIKAK